MPKESDVTPYKFDSSGRLFAQIQADAEIRGTFFESNTHSEVLSGMRHYLAKLRTEPLQDFIDNQAYRDELLKVINPSFIGNILEEFSTSTVVEKIYSKIIQDSNGV